MKTLAALSSLWLLGAVPLAAQTAGRPTARSSDQSESFIGPAYTPTPELAIPRGTVTQFTIHLMERQ